MSSPTEDLSTLAQKIPSSCDPALWLEENFGTSNSTRLRSGIDIVDNGEPLVSLKDIDVLFYDPPPYVAAGAPYGDHDPFTVRQSVKERIAKATTELDLVAPRHKLKIFDGFRPLDVQLFMFEKSIVELATRNNLDHLALTEFQRAELESKALLLFAKPSRDSRNPPPHSTGGAIDLTIVDGNGKELEMGTEIDAVGPEVLPMYYASTAAIQLIGEKAKRYSDNRELLRAVMTKGGFERLYREWWHFSYGDQYWAALKTLRTKTVAIALYGSVELSE